MLPYVEDIDRLLPDTVSHLLADSTLGRHQRFFEEQSRRLSKAIAEAKRVFRGHQP